MKKILATLFNICLGTCAFFYPLEEINAVITSAETYNERHVANQLNIALTELPLLPPALAAELLLINALPASAQRAVLNDLSGEQYANLVQANQVDSQQFMRRMYDAVRFDSLGLCCGQNCNEFDTWASVGGGEAYLKHSHGAKGFRLQDYNVSFGVQKPLNFCLFNSWLTVGLAGNYEHDHIRFNQGGHGNANNWQGALYYMWNNCHFYSFSATILGSNRIKIRRFVDSDFDSLRFRPHSTARLTQWTSYSELGLNWNWDCIYIQPFVGVEYAFYRRHALSEHRSNLLGLHLRGKNVSATIGRVGAHLTSSLPWWGLFLSGDIAWRTRLNFLQERARVRFQEFGNEFRIKGVHVKSNGVEGALNLAKCFCDRWQAYVEVAGEKWERYSAWNVSGGLMATW